MPVSRVRLTPARISAMKPSDKTLRDAEVFGLYVEATPTGKRYRCGTTRNGKTVRHTLGLVSDHSLQAARDWASNLLGKARETRPPTLAQALDEFLLRRDMQGRDATATANYRSRFELHLSGLMSKSVASITVADVAAVHRSLKDKPRTADLVVGNLSTVLSQKAVLHHLWGGNPCSGVDLYRAKPKKPTPMLTPDAIAEWWAATERISSPTRRNMLRLMLLTGLRGKTAKQTRVEWFDGVSLNYPPDVMKSGEAFRLPLNDYAIAIIEAQRDLSHDGWLFPSGKGKGHATVVWHPALKAFGGPHQLRHTFITFGAMAGVPDHFRRLIVNHSIGRDAHAGYIDKAALFEGARAASQQIANLMLAKVPGLLQRP